MRSGNSVTINFKSRRARVPLPARDAGRDEKKSIKYLNMDDLEDLIGELFSCKPLRSDKSSERDSKIQSAKETTQEIKNLIKKLDKNEGMI